VSGSDLFEPVMRLAGQRGFRVFLLGGEPEVAAAAAARLERDHGVRIAGVATPRVGLEAGPGDEPIVEAIRAARPDLLMVCLGAPKGELLIDRVRERIRPAVALQVGASLDFYVGRVRRAPRWMQRAGLEWLFRLLREPRRLAYRYLVQDPRFLLILLRTLRLPRQARILSRACDQAAAPAPARAGVTGTAPR
jgi:N-acetylglucosaminyldiphosphoundecaprenol N-acetyl-beta-D-mannosaminyltransferase